MEEEDSSTLSPEDENSEASDDEEEAGPERALTDPLERSDNSDAEDEDVCMGE
jgi:hypothetical protein